MNLLASLGLAISLGAAAVGLLHGAVAMSKAPKCRARFARGEKH